MTVVQTASRMVELVRDLGDCADSRQILISAGRHFRQLFGDYNAVLLAVENDLEGDWTLLTLESPYVPSWGGIANHQLPADTDTDEIVRRLGKVVGHRMSSDSALRASLIDVNEPFWACDNVLAVRLASLSGAPSRSFMGTPWRRPDGRGGWLMLGYAEPRVIGDDAVKLFTTAVQVTSRLSMYPALVNYIARQQRINDVVRRNLVHDLKTPIAVIKGSAETLEMDDVWEDVETKRELLENIVESCTRLLEDIKDILEPVGEAWTPQLTMFDLSQLLHKVVMAERMTERAKSHRIDLVGADKPLHVQADQRKVRRVIENLLSNAVKYSPGQDKTVKVHLTTIDNEVQVAFVDEGIGMSEVQLERVLNGAGRVVDEKLGIEGSGFGLDSAQTVLEAHGGRLEARSAPGRGSTFVAVLPRWPEE